MNAFFNTIDILVVEDDISLNELLCTILIREGYKPVGAYSGTEALLHLSQNIPKLIILDLMLPGKTGEDVLITLREVRSVPVIVLTARGDKETIVKLLRLGADDYLTKPFDNNELLARIEVQLRRNCQVDSPDAKQTISFRDLTLDIDSYDVLVSGQKANLSKKEFALLKLLMSHPSKVFTKNNIYETVWEGAFLGDDNTVNVHISKLRAKLSNLSPNEEYIQTIWGIGFKMRDDI